MTNRRVVTGDFGDVGLLPPGEYVAVPQTDYDQFLTIHNEVYAAMVFIIDHGKIEIGTPQSRRLRETLVKFGKLIEHVPIIPPDYPREPMRSTFPTIKDDE